MKYVIFGIPGVGKTSVVNGLVEKTSIKNINLGSLLTEIGKELGLIENRDELRKLNFKLQQKIRKATVERIINLHEKYGDILLDTHAAIKTKQGYLPGFDKYMLENLNPDVFIVVWAKPEDIINRRKGDESRDRDADTAEQIADGIRITKQMATTYAVLAGATYSEVENMEGKLEDTINTLEKIVKFS